MLDRKNSLLFALKIFAVCLIFSLIILLLCYFSTYISTQDTVVTAMERKATQVVIDPGHGGRDGGAVSADGIIEKDLNLKVSFALRDILEICGVTTVMTREKDTLVCDESNPNLKGKIKVTDLKNRLKIGNENSEALFISIHMNKFPVEKYSGLQVYYSPNNESGFVNAKSIQEKVISILQPDNTRKVKKAGNSIFLLSRLNSPAVLVECGFLSNESEAKKLSDKNYQTQLSLVIADSIIGNLISKGNN